MDITLKEVIPIDLAFEAARSAPLEAAGGAEILFYRDAVFRLAQFHPDELNPASLYILRKNLDFQYELRAHLMDRYGLDTLQLSDVLHLQDGDKVFGMIPPYVEIIQERVGIVSADGDRLPPAVQRVTLPVLVDGIHRVWMAREIDMSVRCIAVRNTSLDHNYSKYPVEWSEVSIYNEVPKEKARYRRQDKYSFMRPLDTLRLLKAETEYGR